MRVNIFGAVLCSLSLRELVGDTYLAYIELSSWQHTPKKASHLSQPIFYLSLSCWLFICSLIKMIASLIKVQTRSYQLYDIADGRIQHQETHRRKTNVATVESTTREKKLAIWAARLRKLTYISAGIKTIPPCCTKTCFRQSTTVSLDDFYNNNELCEGIKT